jgi:hypothetical protein
VNKRIGKEASLPCFKITIIFLLTQTHSASSVDFIAEGEDVLDGVGILRNSTCVFRNTEPNLVSFYNDQQITEEVVEFPPGSLLVSYHYMCKA